ncbi:sugar O-acetyltransferase [Lactobacillus sp. YT155]|uniref:sugar O-acetyltransferase n=1 Tax=Lactobacillus sp. YT155 TaxID=3060955 RepID=UPI00265EBB5C|nr:sugar O-acetyltransferase [Lactobacillus sp. YT155]MDO1605861.1 sugar O-acetyltransferase [Lactobacillus sp. YT155]
MTKDFEYEQMLNGELYKAMQIKPENRSDEGKAIAQQINNLPINNTKEIVEMERKLFKRTGKNLYINPPVQVDYGRHVEIGDNFYANMDCIFLDVNSIIIGDNVMVGPRTSFLTAGHPTDPEIRVDGYEFGYPIKVEDNVWIGGNCTIIGGVTIGKNSIVGAGAVVTKDVPADSIVGGNPARVIRKVGIEDKKKWARQVEQYHKKLNAMNELN